MSEAVINTIIQGVSGIIIAIIGISTLRNGRRTKDIEKQVVNDHRGKPDLRADVDTIKVAVKDIQSSLRVVNRDIGGLREEQRQTRREVYDQGVYGRDNRHMIHGLTETLRYLEDTAQINGEDND